MKILDAFLPSLGRLILSEEDECLPRIERGDWGETIHQRRLGRRRRGGMPRRPSTSSVNLAGNCFADPTRIRMGGAL